MSKHYQPELDILKALSILAIISIHLISALSLHFKTDGLSHWLLLGFDQAARFSVPLFVALSGYGLGLKYSRQPLQTWPFIKNRVQKLIPLYLFWSVFTYTLVHLIMNWGDFTATYSLPQALLLGRVDYQLYFIPMIFQLYLIFPLLWRGTFTRRLTPILLIVVFGLQAAGFFIMDKASLTDQTQYTIFTSWIGYFFLGIVLSRTSFTERLKSPQLALLLAGLSVLTFTITVYQAHMLESNGVDIIQATRFTRFPVLLYAATAVIISLAFKSRLQILPRFAVNQLARIGRYSYLIFLSHTLLIRLTLELSHQDFNLPVWLTGAASYLLALTFSTKFNT